MVDVGTYGAVAVLHAAAGLSREDYAAVLAGLIRSGVTADHLLPRVAP